MKTGNKIFLFYFFSLAGGWILVMGVYFIISEIWPVDEYSRGKIKDVFILGMAYLYVWGLLNLLFFLPLWRYNFKWVVFAPSLIFIGFFLRKAIPGLYHILLPQLGVQFMLELFAFLKLFKKPETT